MSSWLEPINHLDGNICCSYIFDRDDYEWGEDDHEDEAEEEEDDLNDEN